MKKVIAIDIDDVMSPCAESFIKYHNDVYKTNLSLSDITYTGEYWGYWSRALNNLLGIDEYEANRRFEEFLLSDEHRSGQPISEEIKQYIYSLKKQFRLEVVTARHYSMREQTLTWLNNQLPDVFDEIHFIDSIDKTITKVDVCKQIRAEYIIDDSVEHCNLAAQSGVKAILFGNYGWNSHQNINDGVVRLSNWDDVINYFKLQ